MENMVDALRMAFAVIVFVMALTIAFAVFSQAKATSDLVLYMNDKTNFEEYIEENKSENKIVGMETILPLIARYIDYNENYSVEIQDISGKTIVVFDLLEDQKLNRTELQIRKRLEEQMKELVNKYQNRKFYEIYSEEVYKGEIYTTQNEETFEAINTNTKIKITYRLVN